MRSINGSGASPDSLPLRRHSAINSGQATPGRKLGCRRQRGDPTLLNHTCQLAQVPDTSIFQTGPPWGSARESREVGPTCLPGLGSRPAAP